MFCEEKDELQLLEGLFSNLFGYENFAMEVTPEAHNQARSCQYARERERVRERESNAVIRRYVILSIINCVSIILCRYVPVQYLLIMSTQLNFKSFIEYAKKSSKIVSQKIYRNQITLGIVTINPCHPDYPNSQSLMTECELGDTSKNIALMVVDESTIQDFPFPLK